MSMERILRAARQPTDIASLVALRVAFGVLALVGALRFIANGWVERFFGEPTFFFRYDGFAWVPVPDVDGVLALFIVMAVAAVGVIVGWRFRLSMAVHLVAFTWVELIDVTNYLNHYYLYTLLGGLLMLLPLDRAFAVGTWRHPERRLTHVPAWMLWLIRFQVATVYIYAGLAKAGPDWLLHGQPLNIWLSSRQDFPVLGPLFDLPETALAFSWAGFLHDLLVPFLLLWKRTRAAAYVMLLSFHTCTHLLFNIGMFPFIMTIAATSFFAPDWPRRLAARFTRKYREPLQQHMWQAPWQARPWARPMARVGAGLLGVYCVWQVLMPLRTHLHGGNVLWHEEGMRWSWRVMLREKNGTVTYRVKTAPDARERHIPPRLFLTPHQEREMSGQPDMIIQLGRHIADIWRRDGHPDVEVRVDAICSLNGRVPARLIDPDFDLARLASNDAVKGLVLPPPAGPPPRLTPIRLPVRVAVAQPAPNGTPHASP